MKKITKYEFEKGEMVVEVGKNYFKILAQPEELRGAELIFTATDGIHIRSNYMPEFDQYMVYLQGSMRQHDQKLASFDPANRERIVSALKEFGAEVAEPKEDRYVWFNVYKDHGVIYLGRECVSKAEAEEVGAFNKRTVGRIKIKLEEGRWDE